MAFCSAEERFVYENVCHCVGWVTVMLFVWLLGSMQQLGNLGSSYVEEAQRSCDLYLLNSYRQIPANSGFSDVCRGELQRINVTAVNGNVVI